MLCGVPDSPWVPRASGAAEAAGRGEQAGARQPGRGTRGARGQPSQAGSEGGRAEPCARPGSLCDAFEPSWRRHLAASGRGGSDVCRLRATASQPRPRRFNRTSEQPRPARRGEAAAGAARPRLWAWPGAPSGPRLGMVSRDEQWAPGAIWGDGPAAL